MSVCVCIMVMAAAEITKKSIKHEMWEKISFSAVIIRMEGKTFPTASHKWFLIHLLINAVIDWIYAHFRRKLEQKHSLR